MLGVDTPLCQEGDELGRGVLADEYGESIPCSRMIRDRFRLERETTVRHRERQNHESHSH